jgi:hypothetical protein
MTDRTGWTSPVVDIRRRLLRAAAWYRSARTTFEVLRLLDEQTLLAIAHSTASRDRRRRPFVARTGFVV